LSTTPYHEHVRPEMLPLIPVDAKRILEVGCGAGTFAMQIKAKSKAELWGVEIDPVAAEKAAKVFDRLLTGDVNHLIQELPEGGFDCIICNDVIEHVADPETLLRRLKSKLSPGGIIVASIPNVRAIKNLFNLIVRKDWRYEDFGTLDRTHLRFFTKKSIERLFDETGYSLELIQGINPTRKMFFAIFNVVTLGWARDTRWLNFACVAKART
jgi:2-polyprenyl-3-methyl-5-hydroxy-6-metoxy-1,4-benzoquinol methylase